MKTTTLHHTHPELTTSKGDDHHTLPSREVARRLLQAFLIPSLTTSDWRAKYKQINRAAGVLVGLTLRDADSEYLLRAILDGLTPHEGGVQIYEALEKRVVEISEAMIQASPENS